jgi:drug/metabolite transporter (DMT)-like permease
MHLDGSPGPMIRKFGRRGVFLMMFGTIYACMGAAVLLIPGERFSDIAIVGSILDSNLWGVMWAGGGVVAWVVGMRRARGALDGPGFTALLVPPAVWSTFYTASVVSWLFTGTHGSIRAVPGLAVWVLAWSVVLLISGWPEADPTMPGPTRRVRRR